MKVYVACYQHRHGEDISVYATPEAAEEARRSIAAQWWDREMPEGSVKPESAEDLADAYFAEMEAADEFFSVEEQTVIGA